MLVSRNRREQECVNFFSKIFRFIIFSASLPRLFELVPSLFELVPSLCKLVPSLCKLVPS